MKKLKYITVFILPLTVYIAFNNYGFWTFSPVLFSFAVIPILELFFKPDAKNLNEQEIEYAKKDPFYDALLLFILPIQVFFVIYFFYAIQDTQLNWIEYFGRITALGTMCGIFGINVGHELGHRTENRFQQFFGEILLLTSLETHFLPYHNSGHHLNVATPNDPATARLNEPIYFFWFRSQFGSYFQAWKLEIKKIGIMKKSFFSIHNRMLVYTIAQLSLLIAIYLFFSIAVMLAFLGAAVFGILLLETVNYIEHYGLLRAQKSSGRYERVQPKHSWNSNHMIGRVFLFELSRHSDHHFKANKKYQILEHIPESPQMITGYPGMMLLTLIPPLWFKIMNKQLKEFNKEH